jgi:hypothetical protein
MQPKSAALVLVALVALVVCVVSFWVGVLVAGIFPGWHLEPAKLIIDTAVAVGTVSAVIVALQQGSQARVETRSRAFREAALQHLDMSRENLLSKGLPPHNTRRHWLNFARAMRESQRLASLIETDEQKTIWRVQENLRRDDSYLESFYRVPAHASQDGLGLAEQSLVVIYTWVKWPDDMPDPIDRKTRFTEEERGDMRTMGPRGLAEYIDRLRPPPLVRTVASI